MAVQTGGRAFPGRRDLLSRIRSELWFGALASTLLVVVTRIPFRTRYLLNWDAVQFALGMAQFDLAKHQPHPPGYIGYVALGRAFAVVMPDANAALVALSIVGECAGVVLAFLVAERLFGLFAAWVTAIAMVTSPLYWYYGEAANTYALEPLLCLLVAWPCWRLWHRDGAAGVPAAIAMGVAGALRPSTMFLLTPLFALALLRCRERHVIARSAAVAVLCTAAWAIPLVVLTGGPLQYLRLSLQLGGTVSTGTAIWAAGLAGLELTTNGVLTGIGLELGLFSVVLLAGHVVVPLLTRRRSPVPHGWWTFCLAWSLPALVTFLFVHIGQVVYVQVFTPALVLSLGPALQSMAAAARAPLIAPLFAALATLFNATAFFLPVGYSLDSQLQIHDQQVQQLMAIVGREDPDTTVLLTDASAGGSNYREAQYYLPDYHRIGVGRDRSGELGQVYADTYNLDGFRHARPLVLGRFSTYVFLDEALVRDFVADPQHMQQVALADGTRVYVWRGAPPRVERGQLWLEPATRIPRGPS